MRCWECVRKKVFEKKKASLEKQKLKIKKEKIKKLMLCLRCGKNKREAKKKNSTLCRTCRLESSPVYWGKKAWTVFSLYIRKKAEKEKGVIFCYTCDCVYKLKELQAGHCFHKGNGRYKALDFDEKHIRPQCGKCNVYTGGMVNIFQAKLTRELGIKAVENMIFRRKNELPLTLAELKEIYAKYSEKLKTL